jgi:hypothetical protein
VASELWVNDSGVARQIREVWVNDSGVARRITEIWVNDAGTARLIYVSDVIAISDTTADSEEISPASATASFALASDGDIDRTTGTNSISDQGDWISPQINMASYECRADVLSGTLTSGTTGAWINLGTTRTWTLQRTTNGTSTASFTLQIRRASDAVVLDSATISLSATRDPP